MKIYSFGDAQRPTLMLLPGTCCHWRSNFGAVIPHLERDFRVLCVSYDGFDETEDAVFPTMTEEAEKIEDYILENLGGHIHAVYGCSLGGSFVGLMAARRRVTMDCGILGGSDLDQSPPFAAKLMTRLMLPMVYPLVRDGRFGLKLLQRQAEKQMRKDPEYVGAFMDMFGGARPYVKRESCANQFYSDLITPLPDGIDVPGTEIHVFYALKMGEKYRARYLKHFAHPILHEQNLRHEELLACHPEKWAQLVKSIALRDAQ